MQKLIEYYIQFLCTEIEKRTGAKIDPTIENIMKNLHYLSKREENIEGAQPWIPVDIKRMLLFILFEGKAVMNTDIVAYEPSNFATACSVITVNGTMIAKATKNICYDDVEPFAGYSENKRNVLMKEYAIGSAETRVITKAGIGMDMTGDMKEFVHFGTLSESEQSEQITAGQFMAETASAMEQLLNEDSPSSETANAEPEVNNSSISDDDFLILFGNKKGEKVANVAPKIKAWALACIDTKKSGPDYEGIENVTDAYREKLAGIVLNDTSMKKIYDSFISKK